MLREEKILLALHPVLRSLMKNHAVITRVGDRKTMSNAPYLHPFNEVYKNAKYFELFKFNKSIILDALNILVKSGMAKYKVRDLHNPYDSKVFITDDGVRAYKNSKYRREVAKRALNAAKTIKSFIK